MISPNLYLDSPPKNPFPNLAVISSEGRDFKINRSFEDLKHLEQLKSSVLDYLERTPPVPNVLLLEGVHGAGKTHALRSLDARFQQAPRLPVTFRAFAVDASANAILVQLLGSLTRDTLADLATRYRAAIAIEHIKETQKADSERAALVDGMQSGIPEPSSLIDALESDPRKVDQLVGSYLLGFDLLEDLVAKAISLGDRRHRDFRAAFVRLGDGVYSQDAYRWLIGASLTPDECRRIDVSGPLATDAEYLAALGLLTTLCARARIPFLVILDQYEKLTQEAQGVVLLRSLIEMVLAGQGMLVISGTPEAMSRLPLDMQQRIPGTQRIRIPRLGVVETRGLLNAYFSVMDYRAGAAWMLETPVIEELVRFGSGVARTMLQIAAAMFTRATQKGRALTAGDVQQIANAAGVDLSERAVFSALARCASVFGLRPTSAGSKENSAHSKDITLAAEDGRLINVQILSAVFYTDEASKALAIQDRIRSSDTQVVGHLVIVVGYASEEVTSQLLSIADEVIVFEPNSFSARCEASFAALLGVSSDRRMVEPRAHVRTSLETLVATRDVDDFVVRRRLRDLEQDDASKAWTREREQIAQREWQTRMSWIARDREILQRDSSEATIYPLTIIATMVATAAMMTYWISSIQVVASPVLWSAAVGVGLVGFLAILRAVLSRRQRLIASLAAPVKLTGESELLERFAHTISAKVSRAYTAAVASDLEKATVMKRACAHVAQALAREKAAIVRRRILRAVAADCSHDNFVELLRLLEGDNLAYLADELSQIFRREGVPDDFTWRRIPSPLMTIFALNDVRSRGTGLAFGLISARSEPPDTLDEETQSLTLAFENGFSERYRNDILAIPYRRLSEAAAELSSSDGLGRYVYLMNHKKILEYYLFFEQAKWFHQNLTTETEEDMGAGRAANGNPAVSAAPLVREEGLEPEQHERR